MANDEGTGSADETLGALLDLRTARGGRGEGMLPRPAWAAHTVFEDGGLTHEYVSRLHPLVLCRRRDVGTLSCMPTDISVSVVDRPGQVGWVRQAPRVQVEGGSYPLTQAYLLVRALEEILGLTGC